MARSKVSVLLKMVWKVLSPPLTHVDDTPLIVVSKALAHLEQDKDVAILAVHPKHPFLQKEHLSFSTKEQMDDGIHLVFKVNQDHYRSIQKTCYSMLEEDTLLTHLLTLAHEGFVFISLGTHEWYELLSPENPRWVRFKTRPIFGRAIGYSDKYRSVSINSSHSASIPHDIEYIDPVSVSLSNTLERSYQALEKTISRE